MVRTSIREQMNVGPQRGRRASTLQPTNDDERQILASEVNDIAGSVTAPFESKFVPSDMRQLALVAHNHMKPAMKEFIQTYSEVLKKFRITGTQTTMRMCKTLWGEDNPDIEYGLTCTSGPLGGDAQIAALMCMEDLGALIFFVDPLSAHPHQADIDSLIRLSNCGNVIVCANPTSAMSMMYTLKGALEGGSRGLIPSFFETLESPAVAEYKAQQELALARAVNGGQTGEAVKRRDPSMFFGAQDSAPFRDDSSDDDDDDDAGELLEQVNVIEARRVSLNGPSFSEAAKEKGLVSNLYGVNPKKKKGAKKMMKSVRKSMMKMHFY
mmetsp:Transcript_11287/g.21297  ORF Transcript_11287/g.21297 Transcript_11287/m.21297 type:complete len:325 (-) Transcript_11287:222-1196(-)|eukprot:CAMPEP_0201630460 /NCGR_PEP_ID=MMETSP0493-20130528/4776_1 /ASSEMBLY_ACC=CAM_ASM_000838 /TAXON_ID=420259 /ORGANISM="Thalassiosira gravida, Strain GMp14c1" /LENGTH=324 /DNA_ID=CAMNT_0048101625 /DNA_START=26 /DNA_END=1000 /DNA_ORIENTATION=-